MLVEGDVEFISAAELSKLTDAIDMAANAYRRDGGLSGLATGFADLDQRMGGLQASDLIIIAGRPAMGKTSFALNLAYNAARTHQMPVGLFSLIFLPPERLAEALSLQLSLNDQPIADASFTWQRPDAQALSALFGAEQAQGGLGVALELRLRHARLLEVELVEELAFEQLAHGRHRLHRRARRERHGKRADGSDLLWMVERRAPGCGRAPVVTEDHGRFVTDFGGAIQWRSISDGVEEILEMGLVNRFV